MNQKKHRGPNTRKIGKMVMTSRDQPRRLSRDLVFFQCRYHLGGQATSNNFMFDDIIDF